MDSNTKKLSLKTLQDATEKLESILLIINQNSNTVFSISKKIQYIINNLHKVNKLIIINAIETSLKYQATNNCEASITHTMKLIRAKNRYT